MSGFEYATVAELQQRIDGSGGVKWAPEDGVAMELAINAASRWVDEYMDTRFTAAQESRLYVARFPDVLYTDDFLSIVSVKSDEDGDGVYETTWPQADYRPEPFNATAKGRPYRQLRATGGARFSTRRPVEVTAVFGYSENPPPPIRQAVLLLAHRLWMRKDAVFGVAGTAGLGVFTVMAQIQADADVMALLEGVDRRYV